MNASRVMRGMIVRVSTDRFAAEGVPAGATGLTLYQAEDGRWRLSCSGGYIDADETDFTVVGSALTPRGVVLPSLNGGWLEVQPHPRRLVGSPYIAPALAVWGREPGEDDFFGHLSLVVPGDSTGFPVLWDRACQLKLVYFLGTPDQMTYRFPQEYLLNWPGPELQIDGLVTIDPARGYWARKAAQVRVTTRNPIGDRREVSAELTIPAYTCETASKALVDLFPAVTTDDLDWI